MVKLECAKKEFWFGFFLFWMVVQLCFLFLFLLFLRWNDPVDLAAVVELLLLDVGEW